MTVDEIYEELKKQTVIKSYKIEAEKADNLTIFDSKFGGYPYWDFSEEFPTDSNSEKLNLLAQINFEKENFNDDRLPKTGILQFFISTADDVYGINFDKQDEQKDWRIIYHENVNYNVTEDDIKNNGVKAFCDRADDLNSPFRDTYKLTFNVIEDVLNNSCADFDSKVADILKEKFDVVVEPRDVYDYLKQIDGEFYNKFNGFGHKLFGHPAFTQWDPREERYGRYRRYDTLLLQIDTDKDIMWGDSGVANFFINKEDLLNKDFSKVLYNWDCC